MLSDYVARAVAEGDDAAGITLRVQELKLLAAAVRKEPRALAEDEGVHVEDVLVDEACGGDRLDELAASPHEEAAFTLRLEFAHRRCAAA